MRSVTRKTIAVVLAVLSLCALLLSGCQRNPGGSGTTEQTGAMSETAENTTAITESVELPEETVNSDSGDTFWIVMDNTPGMIPVVKPMIETFQLDHPEVQIKLQVIPTYYFQSDKDKRDAVLQEIRTAMAEGNGPDVFLLPAAQDKGELLFADVNLAMRDGAFADISTYYDADTELEKEGLNTKVLDAGVVDGARYVLPLRYDMPVLYVDTNQLTKEDCATEMLGGTIGELYDAVLASGNPKLATAATVTDTAMRLFSLNFYPELIDYDAGEILLTAEDMVPLLQSIQNARAAEQTDKRQYQNPPTDEYVAGEDSEYWNSISCYYIGGMDDLLSYGIFTCAHVAAGLTMLPVTAVDGSVVADVTYYGAVSADSKNPELAYEFLRWFLTEEGQWQENEDLVSNYIGWPVRAKGDVNITAKKFITNHSNTLKDLADFYYYNLEQNGIGELPILDVSIDRVQLASNYECEFTEDVVDLLNDSKTGAIQDVDITVLLQVWLDKVQQHLEVE